MRRLWAAIRTFATTKHWGVRVARIALVLVVGLLLFTMIFENRFIYFPEKVPRDYPVPKLRGGELEEVWLRTADGVEINGWYCRASGARADMIWFHGNAGWVLHRKDMLERLLEIPVNVLVIDYRGYGKSGDSPGEEGLYEDAAAAYAFLRARGVPPERIVVFGKSLGGAPAVELATRVPCAGLIVQSSFTSARDMAKRVMPFFPAWLVMRHRFDSEGKVGRIACPKLFIHSPADEVIPYELGRRLYDAAAGPKEFWEVPNAGHNETYMVAGNEYVERLRGFVARCVTPPQGSR